MNVKELATLENIEGLSLEMKKGIFFSVLKQYNKINELLCKLYDDEEFKNHMESKHGICKQDLMGEEEN